MPAIVRLRNADGTFGEPKKIGKGETEKERADRLEIEAAILSYNDMMKELQIKGLEESQALLIYQLMQGGVI